MQKFDTPKSYDGFFLYYFPQKPPRSVSRAYRMANPILGKPQGKPDNRQAPSNWRRWAMGQNAKGERKYYRLVEPEGSIKILPIPTWENRATAWDESIRRSLFEKKLKEDEELLNDMKTTVKGAWGRLIQAWHQYSPTGSESLAELSRASYSLSRTIELVHFGKMAGEHDEEPEDPETETGTPELTDIDRVEAIGDLVQKAISRKEQIKQVPPPSNDPPSEGETG
jgi:hypothetical protein